MATQRLCCCVDEVEFAGGSAHALDMLCLTSSMAVAFKDLARSGFRPKGDLIYFGVADEEAGGTHGAKWIVDHHWDAVACDYMVTEMGGFWAGDGKSIMMLTAVPRPSTNRGAG